MSLYITWDSYDAAGLNTLLDFLRICSAVLDVEYSLLGEDEQHLAEPDAPHFIGTIVHVGEDSLNLSGEYGSSISIPFLDIYIIEIIGGLA